MSANVSSIASPTHLTFGLIPPAANAMRYIAEKMTAILMAPGIVPKTKRQRPMR
jgi:hypothetical protein